MSHVFFMPLLRTAAFCAAALTLLLCTGRAPASAADTAYLSLQGAQNPSGLCPYNVNFTSSITGPGNSSVSYYYERYVNGNSTISATNTLTIPAGGTLVLPLSQIKVDSSTAGLQSYQLTITSPPGSDSATHGKLYFTAKCGIIIPPLYPPPPTPSNLNLTTDESTCEGFSPPLFCHAALGSGWMGAWWKWQGNSFYPDVDGFKLYDVSPSNPNGPPISLSVKTSATGQTTYTFPTPPPGGFNGHCYEVSAYKGNAESSRSSPPKCVGNVAVAQTQTYTNLQARSSHQNHTEGGAFFVETSQPGLDVGHSYQTYKGGLLNGDSKSNDIWRLGVRAPLDFLHGHTVYKAVLRMQINGATTGSNYQTTATSCAWEIGMGTGQWWNNSNWIDGDFSNAVSTGGEFPATHVAFDITHLVQAIAGGAPNNGFVLKGREENLDAFTEQSCVTGYTNPAIDVTYI
jgi:hypothetical protein